MKPIGAFAISACVTILVAGGCGRPFGQRTDPMTVFVEGGGRFPATLAGRWKSDQHGWEFVFAPDGRISAAVISLGRVAVVPDWTTTVPTQSGGQAVFTPGPWTVHYEPGTRMLTVKIAMEHVRVPMAANVLEGSSTDVFTGRVSPTGDTWQAEWTAFTHYTATTEDGTPVDLSTDATYGEARALVFVKTAPPKP